MSLAGVLTAPVVAFVVGLCALVAIAAWMLRRGRTRPLVDESGWRGPLPRSREFLAAREALSDDRLHCMDCTQAMPCECAKAYARQRWAPPVRLDVGGAQVTLGPAPGDWSMSFPGPALEQPEETEAEKAQARREAYAKLRAVLLGDGTAA